MRALPCKGPMTNMTCCSQAAQQGRQHITWHGSAWHGMAWHWHWHGTACDMAGHGTAWHVMISSPPIGMKWHEHAMISSPPTGMATPVHDMISSPPTGMACTWQGMACAAHLAPPLILLALVQGLPPSHLLLNPPTVKRGAASMFPASAWRARSLPGGLRCRRMPMV